MQVRFFKKINFGCILHSHCSLIFIKKKYDMHRKYENQKSFFFRQEVQRKFKNQKILAEKDVSQSTPSFKY